MAGKLNQVIAVEKGVKSRVYALVSDLYKKVQKPDLFSGFTKQYRKKDEESEDYAPENKHIQATVASMLGEVKKNLTELLDVTATKDYANMSAVADVAVDGQVLLKGVPVTYLLFLEKQLNDLSSFVGSLPVLDPAETWDLDTTSNVYRTPKIETNRLKKVQKPIVLYAATKEHPAQTAMITEDVVTGYWETIKESGAISPVDKLALTERVQKLIKAVKYAREEANGVEAPPQSVGAAFLGYLLP